MRSLRPLCVFAQMCENAHLLCAISHTPATKCKDYSTSSTLPRVSPLACLTCLAYLTYLDCLTYLDLLTSNSLKE